MEILAVMVEMGIKAVTVTDSVMGMQTPSSCEHSSHKRATYQLSAVHTCTLDQELSGGHLRADPAKVLPSTEG